MTNSADLQPARLAGYGGGPLTYRGGLLDEPLFWLGHLSSCIRSEEGEELLFGADHEAAGDFQRRQPRERAEWPAFTVPLAPDDGHFMGPGLSWPELAAAADTMPPGGSTTDAHARLLLLLPAFGDDAVPDDAAVRLAGALRARTPMDRARDSPQAKRATYRRCQGVSTARGE